MSMRIVLSMVLVLGTGACAAAQAAQKRVAVLDFENAAIQTAAVQNKDFSTKPPDVGKGVAEQLVAKLVQDGGVTVVERAAIDKVIAEQNFSNSDRADPKTAAKIGRILGLDAIVMGTITHYEYTEKIHKANAFFGASNSPKAKYDISAKVQIVARVVSPDTAEVLATADGSGEQERKDVKVDLRDTGARMVMASGANSPVMNESIEGAVGQLAKQLEVKLSGVGEAKN